MHFKIGRWAVSAQQSPDHLCTPGSTCEVMVWDEETDERWSGAGFNDGVKGWVTPAQLSKLIIDLMEDSR